MKEQFIQEITDGMSGILTVDQMSQLNSILLQTISKYTIITNGDKVKEVNRYFEDKYEAKVNIGVVSNLVQKELVKNAILSVLVALIGIIIYVSIRFKFSYAIGGVVALIHDVLIMFSLFAIFRFEVSSMFIAAVLAIIGYSINDTIVLFDRI